jgi:hypothetical protein
VVAVRETNVAISKHTVSIAERMTSAVTASTDSVVDRVTIEATIGNPLADLRPGYPRPSGSPHEPVTAAQGWPRPPLRV